MQKNNLNVILEQGLNFIYDDDGNLDQTKVSVLADTFICNADDSQKMSGGDPFWTKFAKAFMKFTITYAAEFIEVENRNMNTILGLIQAGTIDNKSFFGTELDKIVAAKRAENPKAKCFIFYDMFKLVPAKTGKAILTSIAAGCNQ